MILRTPRTRYIKGTPHPSFLQRRVYSDVKTHCPFDNKIDWVDCFDAIATYLEINKKINYINLSNYSLSWRLMVDFDFTLLQALSHWV